ncbi:MAG: L-serine ammonia-lyase [Nitrosomonas sp.]|uniref:L-serine ammonia-lyase n=1 Tax=Nitrosomonas sp. TaxID=42353 RepID=UPI0027310284|nr:L-serine ammonia-lyase [Nitrosomonas sp.]MDP1787234.1 L-serine ammonia-lyase [Nitrosomonas sp.]MDP2224690.1 L-serine ammonia-lyase [Nitrosomonas sp.]MDP3279580.1 L-serine ammonia-lyase [Nitrosomonas sp.]MDP3663457.1 L-serine ammonia-lyase [Nitrosomonas sp.]MDZ4107376.1 L-serine ammonia-lyase [Nitrosomonas sp.]
MFISVLDLFKIGIGPSSSHTMGPMVAAKDFRDRIKVFISSHPAPSFLQVRCTLRGSLAFTGKGHATDRAVTLGMHEYTPRGLAKLNVNELFQTLWQQNTIRINESTVIHFNPPEDIIFDRGEPLPEHPNGMIFQLLDETGKTLLTETYFSIGGGFITTLPEIGQIVAPIKMEAASSCGFPFDSANQMMKMSADSGLSIAAMKRSNELERISEAELNAGLDAVWDAMRTCLENGLVAEGRLPGGLNIKRRAHSLHLQLQENPQKANLNDWLCAYAMAVNEENAAGHMVVTAPTNGAAGVIPAVIYYAVKHEDATPEQVRDFLLVAGAIGGLIKHNSSISGAEVGCQGEVGSASAMAAAGLCAIKGGTTEQIENAAEIALEHHLGMTCDPVGSLVQVPCIERNGFGAIKAYTASSLAIRGDGQHFMSLDNCIAAMKQTGLEMSVKYKETSLGGLAVSITEC